MPSSVVDPCAVEDENSFPVAQVEPELDVSILDADEEVVGGRREVVAATP